MTDLMAANAGSSLPRILTHGISADPFLGYPARSLAVIVEKSLTWRTRRLTEAPSRRRGMGDATNSVATIAKSALHLPQTGFLEIIRERNMRS